MENTANLQRMFAPRSVAVIGASGNLESVSGRSLGYLKKFAYTGKVYPVNPKYQEIGGYPCYPDVTSLPETPDVALLMVRASLVPGILKECVAKGIPYAIIYSSGFAESSQGDSQEELLSIAREGGMRILGPNCQGLLNLVDRVSPHLHRSPPPGGDPRAGACGLYFSERSLRLLLLHFGEGKRGGVPLHRHHGEPVGS